MPGIISIIKTAIGISNGSVQAKLGMGGDGIAQEGADEALSMCGNAGQTAIIEQMINDGAFQDAGQEAVDQAAESAAEEGEAEVDGSDIADILEGGCDHPEAVGEILDDAGEIMADEAVARVEARSDDN